MSEKREILFRGKRLDNGDWVYGLLTVMCDEYHIVDTANENAAFPIDKCTLGQYIGLLDENGVKIFEDDIVKYRTQMFSCQEEGRGVVEYSEGGWGVNVYPITDWLYDSIKGNIKLVEFKVVGNIHDDTMLLENVDYG